MGTAGHDKVVPPCIKWTILGKCKISQFGDMHHDFLVISPFIPSMLHWNHIKRRQRRFSLPSWRMFYALASGPPFLVAPLRYYARMFSLFLMKNLLFTHIMYYKADHKWVLCFQRTPLRKLYCAGTFLWLGPTTATAIWRYSAFKGALNSH